MPFYMFIDVCLNSGPLDLVLINSVSERKPEM